MKRPPGLWLLLTIVAVWLQVEDVYSIKATALIFGKTSTTTTTTVPDVSGSASEETVTESGSTEADGQNSTKPQLTGNPQIDYIWDPNLPRELNGYNLSEYPFYDGLPDDINFKCDGLHDGFYASVPHKCQVYHHCLFGVRYDFLCANYTAFDQKTFICHFVSEVDCVNSKKFWHRNDALYQAASTTTVKPPTPVYTLPPPVDTAVVPIVPILSRRPDRPRRPPARRRPYDYYEDEYEEDDYYEKPVRRQRPRYRPRVYDEEYEYEDDDYARRPSGRRSENRRPYKPRGSNRRRPYDEQEYQDDDDTRRPDSNRRNNEDNRRPSKRRPPEDDDYDRRSYERPRKKGYRRPIDEEYEDDSAPRRSQDRRKNKNREDSRRYEDEEEEERPRKTSRKNYDRNRNDDSVDEEVSKNKNDKERERDRNRNEEPVSDDRSNKNRERNKSDDITDDDRPLPKPPSSIYSRRRPLVSKVRPPVPTHEQAKYSPKVPKTTTPQPADEEYYDDYEEDLEKKEESRRSYKDNNRKSISTVQSSTKRGHENKRKEDDYDTGVDVDTSTRRYNKRPSYSEDGFGVKERRNNLNSRRRPALQEYDDNEESNSQSTRNNDRKITTTTTSPTTTTSTTKDPPREPVVKVVKRPFLPSRGGNPYASRGLLPIGVKASESSQTYQEDTQDLQNSKSPDEQLENKESPKQSPVVVKIPIRNKYPNNDEEFRPISNRPVTRIVKLTTTTTTTTTEKPRVVEKDPLDEYDVTLNDALNPTLPNLPVRNFPTGFSSQNDYTYNTVQRPRYVIDPIINQASSDYAYRIEQPEAISNNIRYRSIPVYQNYRQTPKVTQAFYSPY